MSFVSSSFEDFLEAFKKRHPKDYGIDPRGSVAVKSPMVKVAVKDPPAPVSVPQAVVLEDEWEPPEIAEMDEQEEWWGK